MDEKKILIALPMGSQIDSEFFSSFLGMRRVGKCKISMMIDSLVYNARNSLVATAIDGKCDYILWLDSDMVFPPDTLERLLADAEENNLDFVSGLCFKRVSPTCPTILKDLYWSQDDKGFIDRGCTFYKDYPKDSLFEVQGAGAAVLLTRVSIYSDVVKTFGIAPFEPLPAMGEDFSFCWRLKECGIKMWCDSRLKIGHIGKKIYDESVWEQEKQNAKDVSEM